jgi:hypothetical protein
MISLNGTALQVATAIDVGILAACVAIGRLHPAWQPDLTIAVYVVGAVGTVLGVSQQTTQALARARARRAMAQGDP